MWGFIQYTAVHPGCDRVQSLLKAVLAPNLPENTVFWHFSLFFYSASTGHLGSNEALLPASLCWSARKRAQLAYEGLRTFTCPRQEESVSGHSRRQSRPSPMLLKHLLCEAVACASTAALLGSKARSWHAGYYAPHTSASVGKETTLGLKCQPLPSLLPNRGQSSPPIQLFPLRNASGFLDSTWHSLETSRKGSSEQARPAQSEKAH